MSIYSVEEGKKLPFHADGTCRLHILKDGINWLSIVSADEDGQILRQKAKMEMICHVLNQLEKLGTKN